MLTFLDVEGPGPGEALREIEGAGEALGSLFTTISAERRQSRSYITRSRVAT